MISIERPREDVSFYTHDGEVEPLVARAGNLVFTGGGLAVRPSSGVPLEVQPLEGYPYHWSRINREIKDIFARFDPLLAAASSCRASTLRINSFHTDPADVYEALRLRPEIFGTSPPASTLVLVPGLPVLNSRVCIDTIGLSGDAEHDALFTTKPGAPMPPHERIWGQKIYAKAVRGGGFIFTAGRTNNVIGGSDDSTARGLSDLPFAADRAEVTTKMILSYLTQSLSEFGASLRDVVRAEIHLSDMTQLAGLERVWRAAFPDNPPSRIIMPTKFPTTYSTIEIEFIARDPASGLDREQIGALGVAPATGHEPLAVRAGPYMFFSGLSAHDGENGLAPAARINPAYPFHKNQHRQEAEWLVQKLLTTLDSLGFGKITPLRRRIMGTDLAVLPQFNDTWKDAFGQIPPTSGFMTEGPLPVPSTSAQIDLIAWCGE